MVTKTLFRKYRELRKPKPSAPDTHQDQPVPSSSGSNPSTSPSISTKPKPKKSPNRKRRYGLEILYDGTNSTDGPEDQGVDIVAIHGLNGDSHFTWTHEKTGVLWLKDLLPRDLPRARIFTYGYPAELFFSKSVSDIIDFSRELLAALHSGLNRSSEAVIRRPIIFICHSLGGLVCKQALLLAQQDDHYEDILTSTISVVFFGTPHRGSAIADRGRAIGEAANAFFLVPAVRNDLIESLSLGSDKLTILFELFCKQLDYLRIVTFYERNILASVGRLVVDRSSAIMGIRGEVVIPLNADHRSMCRFGSRDQEYTIVLHQLRGLCREVKLNRHSADMSLQSNEKRCMSLLYSTSIDDYRDQLPKPVDGTCSWILNDPLYASWLQSKETGLLWVTGDPGCGKTMLSVYLIENLALESMTSTGPEVFYFFCDDKVSTQRDAKEILRSILHQILQRHRSLIKFVKSRWEATGHHLVDSFTALWEIFIRIITESRLGPFSIVVDAIDECEPNTRRLFLKAIYQLLQEARRATYHSRNFVKFLFTSRPSALNLSVLDETQNTVLSIDRNQARISEEIRLVIRNRLGRIAGRLGYSAETVDELETLLAKKAEKSFLWLHIVLTSLEESNSTSKKDFKRIINDFPRKLEATYADFLHRIPESSRRLASTLLNLLLGSTRHLTLNEMSTAYTLGVYGEDYKTVADVAEDSQTAPEQMLHRIVGPFVRIEAQKVSFIHQSVKDFLTGYALSSSDKTIREFGISLPTAALTMTSACIRYLLLEDFTTKVFTRQSLLWNNDDTTSGAQEDNELDQSLLEFCIDLEGGIIIDDGNRADEEIRDSVAERYMFYDYAAKHWAEHYAQCDHIADEHARDAFRKVTQGGSCVLTNWLRYYWFEMDMEYSLPDYFDTIMVAAFFDCAVLLDDCLRVPPEQITKDRALFWAARMGSAKSVEVLLKHGADLNSRLVHQHPPLTLAAHHGHLEVVRILLLDTRIDVDAEGPSGRSALSYAAGNSHLQIFQALFSREDCRPERQDHNHWTPLFWSMERDHTAIGRALLAHDAVDINHVDRQGRSVLSWAAGEGFLQVLDMLLQQPGIDVNLQDMRGRSPLLWAANNGQEEVVDVLTRDAHNLDRQIKDIDGRSALSLACGGGHTDCVRALIKYGCGDVNEEDVSGWAPLAWALECQSPLTVEALLAGRELELNHQDQSKKTVLIWAANYGYLEVVEMMLQQGADPHIVDADGRTALDHAEMYGRVEILSLLKQAMSMEE